MTSGIVRDELERALPPDLPRRAQVVALAACHADLVLAANERLNLTRITTPRELAVKHGLDCLWPWRRLVELAATPAAAAGFWLDLGTGAGYPGILLAALLPAVRFLLVESTRKKAAFLAEAVRTLELANVEVHALRGEDLLRERPAAVVVARAVGPTRDLLRLLKPVARNLGRLILYKGPGVEQELAEAAKDAARLGWTGTVTARFELPEGAGARALLEYARAGA